MRKVLSFSAGFLLGGLAGATTALLLAPDGGTELREQIRARIDELVEEGQKAAAARRAELESQLEAFRSGESLTVEAKPKRS